MQQHARIDADGFYLEPVLFDDGVIPTDEDIVTVEMPDGFYRPRWDGTQWVEDMTQAEIDAVVNAPKEPSPEERIASLEAMMNALYA